MKLTKELLENGVIIRPDGTIRKYSRTARIREGELVDVFSTEGVKSELRNDGFRNAAAARKRIFIEKTAKQAAKEALLIHLYFSAIFLEQPSR